MTKCCRVPLGSLQVIVGLLQLSDIFVQLFLDAARLEQVVLQHGDLLIALGVLLLQFILQSGTQGRQSLRYQPS